MSAAEPVNHPERVQATFCAALVDQWIRDGVRHALIAPGSRSTPMALAIAARAELRVDVFHDERSASFAALGSAAVSGMPALLLCTSGTAATHFHGAVVEAHLSGLPMLVLTADRPPELRDVGAPQTIDQTKLFGNAVRWFHDPGVPGPEAAGTWRALARHALEATLGIHAGPVHLNLPLREPLVGEPLPLPAPLLGSRAAESAAALVPEDWVPILSTARGLIVAGRGTDDPAAVEALSVATGWPVLADPRSGCRGSAVAIAAFDGILRLASFADAHVPDVVVHLGEPPASKVAAQWLAASGAVQVRVSPRAGVIDPSHTITHRFVGVVSSFCTSLAASLSIAVDPAWGSAWTVAGSAADAAVGAAVESSVELDEPAVARVLSEVDGFLVVASSMPVRDLEWFGAADQRATVWSNRGANGIDGTVATAIGIAAATGDAVTVLLGDVALLHDSSSLTALAARDVVVRIVVVDNDGGGIFSFLQQAGVLEAERVEQLFGTPHGTDLIALAQAHGLRAHTVRTADDLRQCLGRPGSQLVRVVSERTANVARHAELHAAITASITP
ncbi:MAG: 2-succinyl-5-enolpyruvyl-6-hydroxy-3-cyclohexene-1-carboxylic-acid synthase [Ilumatobacteraceae bacterium]